MDRGAWWAIVQSRKESDTTEATYHTCTGVVIPFFLSIFYMVQSTVLGTKEGSIKDTFILVIKIKF